MGGGFHQDPLNRDLIQVPARGGAGWWRIEEDFHVAHAKVPAQNLGTSQPISILLFHLEPKRGTSLTPILANQRDQTEMRKERILFIRH